MQHNALVGRLMTQPVMVVKDDTQYCRFAVAELRKRGGNQTKLEFIAFDYVAKHITENCLVGDTVSVDFTITNTMYETDGVNHHGYGSRPPWWNSLLQVSSAENNKIIALAAANNCLSFACETFEEES